MMPLDSAFGQYDPTDPFATDDLPSSPPPLQPEFSRTNDDALDLHKFLEAETARVARENFQREPAPPVDDRPYPRVTVRPRKVW